MEDAGKKESMADKAAGLISILTDQMLEAELTWNVFWSTCEHYKVDSLLRPFPKNYTDRCGDKMIDELVNMRLVRLIFNFWLLEVSFGVYWKTGPSCGKTESWNCAGAGC